MSGWRLAAPGRVANAGYGRSTPFRLCLEKRGLSYVLALLTGRQVVHEPRARPAGVGAGPPDSAGLPEAPGEPGEHLAARAALLHGTYREVAGRVPANSQIEFDDDGRLHFAALEPEPEPSPS